MNEVKYGDYIKAIKGCNCGCGITKGEIYKVISVRNVKICGNSFQKITIRTKVKVTEISLSEKENYEFRIVEKDLQLELF